MYNYTLIIIIHVRCLLIELLLCVHNFCEETGFSVKRHYNISIVVRELVAPGVIVGYIIYCITNSYISRSSFKKNRKPVL